MSPPTHMPSLDEVFIQQLASLTDKDYGYGGVAYRVWEYDVRIVVENGKVRLEDRERGGPLTKLRGNLLDHMPGICSLMQQTFDLYVADLQSAVQQAAGTLQEPKTVELPSDWVTVARGVGNRVCGLRAVRTNLAARVISETERRFAPVVLPAYDVSRTKRA